MTDIAIPNAQSRGAVASQATTIEQSRAIAEVQAAVVAAKSCPRDVQGAIAEMREACAQRALADRAFFSYRRAGSTVNGETIHLARELARIWGNVQYGIAELRRDDAEGVSEVQAFAWDVQANTRPSTAFIVPHQRDTRDGRKPLTDLRDVYENNANQGARRVREMIFAILPRWFIDEAVGCCRLALAGEAGAKPLAERVADAVNMFEARGVRRTQLEDHAGMKVNDWTSADVVNLGILYRSIERGEISRDEAFPAARATVADITGPPQSTPDVPVEEPPEVDQ